MISKPTRNSKTNATVIDHTNTSNFLKTDIKNRNTENDILPFYNISNF